MNFKIYNNKLSNKIFSKDAYSKHIFRYKKDKEVTIIDSDSEFSNINFKTLKKEGNSILCNVHSFRHKHYKEMQLKTFLPFVQANSKYEIATKLLSVIESASKQKTVPFLQVLNPTKGGFYGQYAGIMGFIPRSQISRIILRSTENNLTIKNISTHLYFSNLHKLNNLLSPRIFFKVGKISIIPYYVKNNFVSFSKKRVYNSKLNFVFIAQ